ncbi:MAG: NGG1p interacting factor NIF3 [Candidatus Levybacteria bacterium]|nr:NGG1p interacting factor NIF3 [Candidatus Levybacteria bacterium]
MTIQQIYDLAVAMGMKADPRGAAGVKEFMSHTRQQYEKLSEKKKKYFDKESLIHPYSDSRLLFGDPKKQVKKVMAGIDAEVGEVLMVDRLNERREHIDLLISHHPDGHALSSLHEVMDVQIDMYKEAGVPENIADALFEERKGEVKRRFNPLNHARTVDAARLLGVPLLALHTIWDNMGHDFMEKYVGKRTFYTAGDVLDYINEIPEFIEAIKGKAGPALVSGSENRRAGKIVVGFTGGTNPSVELYKEMAKAGVGTIIEMHVGEDALKELRKLHVNVIDAGHMAADSIGANLFLDQLEKHGIEVVPCSGLVRIKRVK